MKNILIVLMCISCIILISCKSKEENQKIKAGFIYIGPISDSGWTYAHEQARQALNKLDFVEKTTAIENISEMAIILSLRHHVIMEKPFLKLPISTQILLLCIAVENKHQVMLELILEKCIKQLI